MSRIALTDLETSGLDPAFHEIVEIGVVVFDSHTLEIENQANIKVWPRYPERFDKKAQEVNGYTAAKWRTEGAVHLEVGMREYAAMTKDCVLMAFNSPFDCGFLDAAERRLNMKLAHKRWKICLRTMAWLKMPHQGMFSWSMKEVCQKLGLEPEPAVHRALTGALKEFEIYKALMT